MKIKERQRKQIDVWQKNNYSKKLEYNRKYARKIKLERENNQEKDLFLKQRNNEYQKKWYLYNTDKSKIAKLNWRKNNPDKYYQHNKLRRIRESNASGNHTFGEWETLKAQYNWTCPCCKKQEPKIILTEDHIIPLSKGGSHNIENIQPLCRSCNSIKSTKTIKY